MRPGVPEIIELPLSDVDSGHCALIVDKEPGKIDGIKKHKVEFNNHKAIIEIADEESASQAVSAIRDPGYGVTTMKNNFQVSGLSCASCALSVEKKLKAEPGVINASVNYASSTADVEYIPGVANLKHFKSSIQSIGYDLNIDESLSLLKNWKIRNQKIIACLSKELFFTRIFCSCCYHQHVFYEYALRQFYYVGIGNPGSVHLWKTIFYKCMEAGKAPQCQYGYIGSIEYRYRLYLQCIQYAVSSILGKQGLAGSCIF